MSKSREICKILANILNREINVPYVRDSAFIGNAMNVLLGLDLYPDYQRIVDELIKFETFNVDPNISEEYKSIFRQWQNLKNKINNF